MRHEITIFDVDLRNGSNCMFKVQLKMVFAVVFHFVMSHFRCQKRTAIRSQQSYDVWWKLIEQT